MKTLLALFVLAIGLHAQSLPDNLYAAGVGFQSAASPQTSGWLSYCHRTGDRIAACLATDYTGSTTSQRAEIMTHLYTTGRLHIFGKAGAGTAQGNNGGVGAAYSAGGVALFDLKVGLHAVVSISWLKQNVSVATTGNFLQDYASKAVFRFGFGRSW